MYMVNNQITIDAIIAIPTISCAEPVRVNHAIKKPSMVKICAIDSFIASTNHLPNTFRFLTLNTHLTNSKGSPSILYKNLIAFLIT